MDFALTDEQQDFASAIRDFCARECGTRRLVAFRGLPVTESELSRWKSIGITAWAADSSEEG